MEDAIVNLLQNDPEMLIPFLVIGGGMILALIIVTISTIAGVIKSRHFEGSRREIAAYIAEGSISADEGERLLRTPPPKSLCSSK